MTAGCFSHVAIVIYPDLWFETNGSGSGFTSFHDLKETCISGTTHIVSQYPPNTSDRHGSVTVRRLRNTTPSVANILKAITPNIALEYPCLKYFLPLIAVVGETPLVRYIIENHRRQTGAPQTPYCSQLVFRILRSLYPINSRRQDDHISPNRLYRILTNDTTQIHTILAADGIKLHELHPKTLSSINTVQNLFSDFQRPHNEEAWNNNLIRIAGRNSIPPNSLPNLITASVLSTIQGILTNPRHFRLHECFWKHRYR